MDKKGIKTVKKLLFVLLTIFVLAISVCLVIKYWEKTKRNPNKKIKNEKEISKEMNFPYELEDGKLKVTSFFQYSGSNPDCNNEMGENIASISFTNISNEHLRKADFTAVLADGTEIDFTVTDVPAGKSAMVFSKKNIECDVENVCKSITAKAEFEDTTEIMADKITIEVKETEVTLTNTSAEDLTNLNVHCHCLFDGNYYGGLTYSYPVESIEAGKSVTLQADECYLGEADVVRITKDK